VSIPPEPTTGRAPGFPVVLDLTRRRCLVVGGGPVASRRAERLVASGGRVTVVAPRTVGTIDDNRAIEVVRRPYRRGEAAQYHLVITATGSSEVDRAVVDDATAAGVLVSSADQGTPGTVGLPAVYRDGPVTVAISTGGASPGLALWLRTRVVSALPGGLDTLAGLVEETRRRLRQAGRPTDSVDWATVLDEQVVPLVEAGRAGEARAVLDRL
jgi:siroheme synthase-like protein